MDDIPLIDFSRRTSYWSRLRRRFRHRNLISRSFSIGELPIGDFPPNNVCNQKYTIITFLPLVLLEEFKYFYNIYFIVMALLQFVPTLSIGDKVAYWGPMLFVWCITLIREAILELRRFWRDREINQKCYKRLNSDCTMEDLPANRLRVGDIVKLNKGDRIPADMILLRTDETSRTVFIRTDQLDGESNWKLRVSIPGTQDMPTDEHLVHSNVKVFADKPDKDIHTFIGNWYINGDRTSLDITNTLWSDCVLASENATGVVIYTGADTRAAMNTPTPRTKVGRLDHQVNNFTILLFIASIATALVLMILKGFDELWQYFLIRFVLLFSYIIPISLSVNLTIAKTFISLWIIQRDKEIEGTVMRSMTIPEELGRVEYLLVDKTGTLTKNEMVFKKIFVRDQLFDDRNGFYEVKSMLMQYASTDAKIRDVYNCVLAMALCHNVTPTSTHGDDSETDSEYQASSPDEVALVKWTAKMGVSLQRRDLNTITLRIREDNVEYQILDIFPFTSETKMMGIIVQLEDQITYFVKGADTAFQGLRDEAPAVAEACNRLAAEGLRTMVVGMKPLTLDEYNQFKAECAAARAPGRGAGGAGGAAAARRLHRGARALAATGVEDTLADRVPHTLLMLKEAGIKIWMLTGDKLESALCIARSLQLGSSSNEWQIASPCVNKQQAYNLLTSFNHSTSHINLVIEGETLEKCFEVYLGESVSLLARCRGVVVARCSPTQKALVAAVLRGSGAGVAAAGDGGNDIAMIRRAHIGIGIEGKEGRAASLAADVSVRQLWCVARLLLLHGRRASLASAALTMFIVHRGIVISTMQAIFSTVFYFSSVSLYPPILMAAYATIYTVLPVFSLVLDEDIPTEVLLSFPYLYKKMPKGRHHSYKTFLFWMAMSIYQGAVIMFGALILFNDKWIHIAEISYTSLILTELIMVAVIIRKWHYLIVLAELISLAGYVATLLLYKSYFDPHFVVQPAFWWELTVITTVSCFPMVGIKIYRKIRRNRKLNPAHR